jgi:hypothetical protein
MIQNSKIIIKRARNDVAIRCKHCGKPVATIQGKQICYRGNRPAVKFSETGEPIFMNDCPDCYTPYQDNISERKI